MFQLDGYEVGEGIYRGRRSSIFKGSRKGDRRPVIIKLCQGEFPDAEEVRRVRHEFEIGKELKNDNIIQYQELVRQGHGSALIQEDYGAISLAHVMPAGGWEVADFVSIALQITYALRYIHANNIIHKDIKPGNVVINEDTGLVKLIDFGLSTRLSREAQGVLGTNRLQGTPRYISPEQTGRINRSLDYRSDFYSLGATFYELLTARPPFEGEDPQELIHAHITRSPEPLTNIKADIPAPLAGVVMKLLKKSPEERYQSAQGILHDLQFCYDVLVSGGAFNGFIPGQKDQGGRFNIPEKLYGREKEIESLKNFLNDPAPPGDLRSQEQPARILILKGSAGIGKSALVNELKKPVAEKRGYFISGKFEVLNRDIAYSAFSQAFRSLVRRFMGESDAKLEGRTRAIEEALGENAQVVVDIVPELETLLGPSPEAPHLGPREVQIRFHLAFCDFIQTLTSSGYPLVLFLDDLQWADTASINLLVYLATEGSVGNLRIICAYRDNEVDAAHPFVRAREEIQERGEIFADLQLEKISREAVGKLLVETLGASSAREEELSGILYNLSGGNPFFLRTILEALYQEGELKYNAERGWDWEVKTIANLRVEGGVANFIARRLEQMPPACVELLKIASCMGNTFSRLTLEAIAGLEDFTSCLEVSINSGLLFQKENELYFVHDRVQEAAYFLADEGERKKNHQRIGDYLLAYARTKENIQSPLDWEDKGEYLRGEIFEISNQFHEAGIVPEGPGRLELIWINYEAGRLGAASGAYRTARVYFSRGIDLLEDGAKDRLYKICLELYLGAAQNAYLEGEFELAETLFEDLQGWTRNELDRVRVLSAKIVLYTNQMKWAEALELGYEAYEALGVHFPRENKEEAVQAEREIIEEKLTDENIDELLKLRESESPEISAAIDLYSILLSSLYFAGGETLSLVTLKLVNLSLEYGHSRGISHVYVVYGLLLGAQLGRYREGYDLAMVGLKISENYGDPVQRVKATSTLGIAISHWSRPLEESLDILSHSYTISRQNGELVYAGFSAIKLIAIRLHQGAALGEVLAEYEKYGEFIRRTRNPSGSMAIVLKRVCLALRGETHTPWGLSTDDFDEDTFLEELRGVPFANGIQWMACGKMMLSYLHHHIDEGLEWARVSEENLGGSAGQYMEAEHYFYHILLLCAKYPELGVEEKERYKTLLEEKLIRMKTWAANCPENFRHQYLLLKAEIGRVKHVEMETVIADYNAAILGARQNGFTQHSALFSELYGMYWLECGQVDISRNYILGAHYLYERWGATTQMARLEERHESYFENLDLSAREVSPGLLKSEKLTPVSRLETVSASWDYSPNFLGLENVLKVLRNVGGETSPEKLPGVMLVNLMENASARRGALILRSEEGLVVRARAHMGGEGYKKIESPLSIPLEECGDLAISAVQYVYRSGEDFLQGNVAAERSGVYNEDFQAEENRNGSLLCIPIRSSAGVIGVLYLENNLTTDAFAPEQVRLLELLLPYLSLLLEKAAQIEDLKTNSRLKERFFPERFMELLGKEDPGEALPASARGKEMTVLFGDLGEFVTRSVGMTVRENFRFLNSYLEQMGAAIRKHGGIIEKIMGDTVKILFPGNPGDAVNGVREIQRALKWFSFENMDLGFSEVFIGFGLHRGRVNLGVLDTGECLEATSGGESVRVAMGVSELTRRYRVPALVTGALYEALSDRDSYLTREIDVVNFPGMKTPVVLYELYDIYSDEQQAALRESLSYFREALEYYRQEQLDVALQAFEKCLEIYAGDPVAGLYVKRCRELL